MRKKFLLLVLFSNLLLVTSCRKGHILYITSSSLGKPVNKFMPYYNLSRKDMLSSFLIHYDLQFEYMRLVLFDVDGIRINFGEVEVTFFSINQDTLTFIKSEDDAFYDKDKTIRFHLSKKEHEILVREALKDTYKAKLILSVRGEEVVFDMWKKEDD